MKRLQRLAQTCLLAGLISTAQAAPPMDTTQVPGYYKMTLGSLQLTALFDGALNLDTKLLQGIPDASIAPLLKRMFVTGPKVQTAVNAYLIHTGEKLVLVDAGVGASQMFGPGLGQITNSLKAAGYTAKDVDVILLTHLHPDHANGIVNAEMQMAFPNAQVWSSKADNDYWLNPEVAAKAPKDAHAIFEMARNAAAPYQAAGRWKTFAGDEELLPGIRSLATPGHTPGHTSYMIESKDSNLVIWGDVVHNHAVQFAHPEAAMAFDVDQKQAIATRKKLFDKVASEKLLVAGMHMPFPGLGHIRKDDRTYTWVPVEFSPLTAPKSPKP